MNGTRHDCERSGYVALPPIDVSLSGLRTPDHSTRGGSRATQAARAGPKTTIATHLPQLCSRSKLVTKRLSIRRECCCELRAETREALSLHDLMVAKYSAERWCAGSGLACEAATRYRPAGQGAPLTAPSPRYEAARTVAHTPSFEQMANRNALLLPIKKSSAMDENH